MKWIHSFRNSINFNEFIQSENCFLKKQKDLKIKINWNSLLEWFIFEIEKTKGNYFKNWNIKTKRDNSFLFLCHKGTKKGLAKQLEQNVEIRLIP